MDKPVASSLLLPFLSIPFHSLSLSLSLLDLFSRKGGHFRWLLEGGGGCHRQFPVSALGHRIRQRRREREGERERDVPGTDAGLLSSVSVPLPSFPSSLVLQGRLMLIVFPASLGLPRVDVDLRDDDGEGEGSEIGVCVCVCVCVCVSCWPRSRPSSVGLLPKAPLISLAYVEAA